MVKITATFHQDSKQYHPFIIAERIGTREVITPMDCGCCLGKSAKGGLGGVAPMGMRIYLL